MNTRRSHRRCLADAVGVLQLRPEDVAAHRLAHAYAAAIDAGGDLTKLGPPYLAALAALGLTPAARKAVAKGGTADEQRSPLDELRRRRAARAD